MSVAPDQHSSLQNWLDYLKGIHSTAIDLGLSRMQPTAEKLGLVHLGIPTILIAGTNGKGSTVATLDAVYQAAGYKTATVTSPHLIRFNERIKFSGQEADDKAIIDAFCKVEAARDTSLSFFEFTALAELLLVKEQQPDVAILEIGLGGRLDAMNVVEPDVSIVTSVGMDHQDWLGNTREKIGFEKAGVYRSEKPAICGDEDPPVTLLDHAMGIDTQYLQYGKDFSDDLLLGHPQKTVLTSNAACALMAVNCLQQRLPVSDEAIVHGLSSIKLTGRQQIIHDSPVVMLDVAHNPSSATVLAKRLQEDFPVRHVLAVCGMLADKDMVATLKPLVPVVDQWYFTGLDVPRGQDVANVAKKIESLDLHSVTYAEAPEQAFRAALEDANEEDMIVVFGSFYTIAAVMNDGESK